MSTHLQIVSLDTGQVIGAITKRNIGSRQILGSVTSWVQQGPEIVLIANNTEVLAFNPGGSRISVEKIAQAFPQEWEAFNANL